MTQILMQLGNLWTLPNTLLGLVLALTSRCTKGNCRSVFAPLDSGFWAGGWFVPVDTLSLAGWFLRKRGMVAITIGRVVMYLHTEQLTPSLVKHEARHVFQYLWLGPLFIPAYGLSSLLLALNGKDPYSDNVFEQDARKAEK